jgi:hypothetical protein
MTNWPPKTDWLNCRPSAAFSYSDDEDISCLLWNRNVYNIPSPGCLLSVLKALRARALFSSRIHSNTALLFHFPD